MMRDIVTTLCEGIVIYREKELKKQKKLIAIEESRKMGEEFLKREVERLARARGKKKEIESKTKETLEIKIKREEVTKNK